MFGEVGEFIPRPTSQTPNGRGTWPSSLRPRLESWDLVGHILVSRIGDAGCTESGPMVPKQLLKDPMKSVSSSGQQECGHGS